MVNKHLSYLSSKHELNSVASCSIQGSWRKGKAIVLTNNNLMVGRKNRGRLDQSKDSRLGEMHFVH